MKKTILKIFLSFFLLLTALFLFSSDSFASFACTYSTNPSSNLTSNTKTITITVNGGDNLPDGQYSINISGLKNLTANATGGRASADYTGVAVYGGRGGAVLTKPSGDFTLNLYKGNTALCTNSYTLSIANASAGGGSSCKINFINTSFKPSDSIITKITGDLATNTNIDELYVSIQDNDSKQEIWGGHMKRADFVNSWGFAPLPTGNYTMLVQNNPIFGGRDTYCVQSFYVDPTGGGILGSGGTKAPPGTPCYVSGNSGTCSIVATGLGMNIGTDPQSIVQGLFGLILSSAGGIALLLIIISGYRILVSQGNPEALKGAREQLTAAIVGLLFIILSVAVLQIIGINILRIPGFGK